MKLDTSHLDVVLSGLVFISASTLWVRYAYDWRPGFCRGWIFGSMVGGGLGFCWSVCHALVK